MKHFHNENNSSNGTPIRSLLEVASFVIRLMKTELGRRLTTGLTYSQIRALGYLDAYPGASLSEAAELIGLGAPTTSKVMEELVQQGLVRREVAPDDRRRVRLHITAEGKQALEAAAEPARAKVAELLARLTPEEQQTVERAMELLLPLFQPGGLHIPVTHHEPDAPIGRNRPPYLPEAPGRAGRYRARRPLHRGFAGRGGRRGGYRVEDGQVVVPPTTAERKGIQPVVTVKANGGECAEVQVGQPVTFTAVIEVPSSTGKVVAAEWDFEGAGTFPVDVRLVPVDDMTSRVTLTSTHTFSRPGTYFPTLRAVSQRQGDAEAPFAWIQNLGRVRVVVR